MNISIVGKAYAFQSLIGDDIVIGDPADADFHPKITLNRWKGECWFRFGFDDTKIATKNVQLTADNKVYWSTPLFDFKFYGIDKDDDGLEFEIVLKQKPPTNKFSFPVQTQNLKFYYQQPLNKELDPREFDLITETEAWKEGRKVFDRPENVVGSYSAYHATKIHNEYKTGKAFHLYRPKLTDADGKTAWGEFNDDLDQTHILTITLPQSFLDTAKYPVTIDPTFGYTTIGASSYNPWSQWDLRATRFQAPEAGNITAITARINPVSADANWRTGVYADDNNVPTSLLGGSDTRTLGTGEAWYEFTHSTSVAITGSVYYWLGVKNIQSAASNYYIKYDSGDTSQSARRSVVNADLPNPFSPSGYLDYKFSIYATYTESAVLKEVLDNLSSTESILRNKTLGVSDSVSFADSFGLGDRTLSASDSAELTELVAVVVGEVMKYVMDTIALSDEIKVNETLLVSDMVSLLEQVFRHKPAVTVSDVVSLVEVVEMATSGIKKTRLFLILGDLAIQLTGD